MILILNKIIENVLFNSTWVAVQYIKQVYQLRESF